MSRSSHYVLALLGLLGLLVCADIKVVTAYGLHPDLDDIDLDDLPLASSQIGSYSDNEIESLLSAPASDTDGVTANDTVASDTTVSTTSSHLAVEQDDARAPVTKVTIDPQPENGRYYVTDQITCTADGNPIPTLTWSEQFIEDDFDPSQSLSMQAWSDNVKLPQVMRNAENMIEPYEGGGAGNLPPPGQGKSSLTFDISFLGHMRLLACTAYNGVPPATTYDPEFSFNNSLSSVVQFVLIGVKISPHPLDGRYTTGLTVTCAGDAENYHPAMVWTDTYSYGFPPPMPVVTTGGSTSIYISSSWIGPKHVLCCSSYDARHYDMYPVSQLVPIDSHCVNFTAFDGNPKLAGGSRLQPVLTVHTMTSLTLTFIFMTSAVFMHCPHITT